MTLVLAQIAGSELSYSNTTTVHPIGLAMVLALGVATFLLPRAWAVLPVLIVACFIAAGQRFVVVSLDFNFVRVMVLFAWLRVLVRGELAGFRLRGLDVALVAWALVGTAAYTAQWGDTSALVNRLGVSFDAIGNYFFLRCMLRQWNDIVRLFVSFALISVVCSVFFLVERVTGRNLFAVFGGVPLVTEIRQGRLRCQGAFSHPILAGCFWAATIPFIGSLWFWSRRYQQLVVAALGACLLIVFCCASSTPVIAVLSVGIGSAFYHLRFWMGWVQAGVVCMLIGLHLVMNKPVWHLIARMDVIGGSTGWHRYHLIDAAIRHVHEWWAIGVKSTAHWGYGLQDVTNQYVLEGVRGGLATLLLFLLTVALAFRNVGIAWRKFDASPTLRITSWAVGVALFIHCTSFIAVSYFGQSTILWYMTLAVAAALPGLPAPKRVVRPAKRPRRAEGLAPQRAPEGAV